MYFTGRPRSFTTDTTNPPLAVPSNLVTITPSIPTYFLQVAACSTALRPRLPSTTRRVSCGPVGTSCWIAVYWCLNENEYTEGTDDDDYNRCILKGRQEGRKCRVYGIKIDRRREEG
jgi:hypothetical protein